ncbi:MAG: TRAP transporter permease [Rubrobacteraceae bacterium]
MAQNQEEGPGTAQSGAEVTEKYSPEARYRQFRSRVPKLAVTILAVGLALYSLYAVAFPFLSAHQHRAIFLSAIMALAFLLYPPFSGAARDKLPWYDAALAVLSFVPGLYVVVFFPQIVLRGTSTYNGVDLAMAILTIVLVLESTRRLMGLALPLLGVAFLLYGYLGRIIPVNIFAHRGYALEDLAAFMYMGIDGIYGVPTRVAATYIILFIIFGAIMAKSGLGQFFNEMAMAIAGRSKGGPAKVAVISSGFMGSINGSALANVVSTGALTIPLMKRVGYRATFAGAVEASASVGGQILPPIMGAAAFIMAETLGISYTVVILAGILPALLYYSAVITQVHLRADRMDLTGMPEEDVPKVTEVLKERGHLMFPLLFLIYMLFFANVSVTFAAFWTILVTLVVAQIRKSTRMSVRETIQALEDGARMTIGVALACAAVGLIIGVAALTGFGLKLASGIIAIGGASLFLSLVFTMFASIALGIGLPSIPAYIITVTVAAPALVQLGVEDLTAHMFVFYFGIFANLTPPVALAAFAAAGLSGANPMTTGFQSLRLAVAGFIVPYMFVYSDTLLLNNVDQWTQAIPVALTAIVGVLMLAVAIEGYIFAAVPWLLRGLLIAGSLLLIWQGILTDAVGITIAVVVMLWQWRQGRQKSEPATE